MAAKTELIKPCLESSENNHQGKNGHQPFWHASEISYRRREITRIDQKLKEGIFPEGISPLERETLISEIISERRRLSEEQNRMRHIHHIRNSSSRDKGEIKATFDSKVFEPTTIEVDPNNVFQPNGAVNPAYTPEYGEPVTPLLTLSAQGIIFVTKRP